MGFRDDIRELAFELRALPGEEFEIRPYTVEVVTRTWSGDYPGEGLSAITTTPITEAHGQPPKVRVVNDEQRALGNFPKGSLRVGPITPDFPGGGTSIETLNPSGLNPGESFYYVITGPDYPDGARFLVTEAKADKTFGFFVTLAPFAGNEAVP